MSWRIAAAIALAMLCVQAPARASDAPAPNARGSLPRVTVEGTANLDRETRPISDLVDALDVFERERARLAPQAQFRIRVLARLEAADEQQLRLELRHGSHREPIELDGLGRFAVPLAWRQLPADAVVRSSLPKVGSPGAWTSAARACPSTRAAWATCAWNAAPTSTVAV